MIDNFEGKYRFLSNFYEHPLTVDGLTYRNAEAAFHAAKSVTNRREEFTTLSARDAKRLGRKVDLRPDWEIIKDDWMYHVLQCKFSDAELKIKLIMTGDEDLKEGNTWHDNYWGSCTCEKCKDKGRNKLGLLLMKLRSELKEDN